jgi:hypothetical protein
MRSRVSWLSGLSLAYAATAAGQEADSSSRGSQRHADSTPQSLWTRRATDSMPDASARAMLLARRNVWSAQAGARILVPSTIAQISNSPELWGRTPDGFARRAGRNLLSNAGRDLLINAGTAAFGQDPRYQRCACRGAGARVGHALSGLVMFGAGGGRRSLGPALLLSSAGAGLIDAHLFESGTVTRHDVVQRASMVLARAAVTNVAFEFRDDLRAAVRKVLRR